MRTILFYFLVLSVLSGGLSCSDGEDTPQPDEERVLLFYMAVDEVNISFDWYDKIEAILKGAAGTSGDILIYSDPERSAPRLDGITMDQGKAVLQTLEQYDEENSASATVLARVIGRMRELYPRRQYGLVIFTHSSGWLPAGTLLDPLASRSIGIDDRPGNGETARKEMELADFSQALPDGLFDFIIFESCLTANVEVAYALRNKTPYIVASAAEIVSPGYATVYPNRLSALMDLQGNPEENLTGFASAFFEEAKNSDKYDRSATIGVIRTAYLEELAASVREILADPSGSVESPDDIQYFDRYRIYQYPAHPRFFDLEDYIERIASPGQLSAFREILGKTMLYREATASFMLRYQGFVINRHCGLTTYIERPEYDSGIINSEWRKTAWYKATH